MADLIERQEAMYAVQEHYNKGGFDSYQDGDEMLKEIMAIPSVDAVPVVRCKDCKWCCQVYGDYACEKFIHWVRPVDFCSHGERRENG